MRRLAFCLGVSLIVSLSACKSQETPAPAMKADGASAPPAASLYREETKDGRIYVLGTQGTIDNFEKLKATPQVVKTFIGSGPSGETVVFEADSKSPDLQNRLRQEFNRRHNLNLQ